MKSKNIAIASMLSLALAVGGGGMLAKPAQAAVVHRRPPTILTPADLALAASIQATLNNDDGLGLANFSAAAKDGAVYLTGFARSDDQRLRAIEDAMSVPGVKTVRENIVVVNTD